MKRSTLILAAAAGVLLYGVARAEDAASFSFSMKQCVDTQMGDPGATVTWDDFVSLKTLTNTQTIGPQGWSISLLVEGGDATINVFGVKVDVVYDKTDKKTKVVTHYDTYQFDLGDEGDFVVAEAGRGGLADDGTDTGLPADAKGVVSVIVLKQQDPCTLQPAVGLSFDVAQITCTGTIPSDGTDGTFKLSFHDGLIPAVSGGQPVANNVVEVVSTLNPDTGLIEKEAKGFVPTSTDCSVKLTKTVVPPPTFFYTLVEKGKAIQANNDIVKDVPPGPATVDVEVRLTSAYVPDPDGPKGWSISLANEPCMAAVIENSGLYGMKVHTIYDQVDKKTKVVTHYDDYLLDVGDKADFTAFADSTGDYVNSAIPGVQGLTCGVVLKQQEHCVLFPNPGTVSVQNDPVLMVQYKMIPDLNEGDTTHCKSYFLNGLMDKANASIPDNPYVENTVTLDVDKAPTSFTPYFSDLYVNLHGAPADVQTASFVRGKVNGQQVAGDNPNKVNLADVVYIVQHIIDSDTYPILCVAAGDLDQDGNITVSDALWLINYLFQGGSPPPNPFPLCGAITYDATNTKEKLNCPQSLTLTQTGSTCP